jgi:hypothetical protein
VADKIAFVFSGQLVFFEELPLSDPMAIETISLVVIKKSKKACLD